MHADFAQPRQQAATAPVPIADSAGLHVNLDFLRAAAVLCVVFAHLYETVVRHHSSPSQHLGQLGVIIFFVHTSLVLMMSLERSPFSGSLLLREFFINRLFRLYPLSIFCVLMAYCVPDSVWSIRELATNLTLTFNLTYDRAMVGGLWTLPLEVQMYLVLPFLFLWLRNRPAYWVLGLWLASLPVALVQPFISARLNVLSYVPCFLGGIVAWRMGGRKILPGWLWPAAIIIAAVPWMMAEGSQLFPRWITCLMLGLAIPRFHPITSPRLIRASQTIAKYSYGIYLTHVAALTVTFGHMSGYPLYLRALAFAVLAGLLPFLAYHLLEHPMIIIGKRLSGRSRRASHLSAQPDIAPL